MIVRGFFALGLVVSIVLCVFRVLVMNGHGYIRHSFSLHIPDNMPPDVVRAYLERVNQHHPDALVRDERLPNGSYGKRLTIEISHTPNLATGPFVVEHQGRVLQALTSALVAHTNSPPIDIEHTDHTGRVRRLRASPTFVQRMLDDPHGGPYVEMYRDSLRYLEDPKGERARQTTRQLSETLHTPQTRLRLALENAPRLVGGSEPVGPGPQQGTE